MGNGALHPLVAIEAEPRPRVELEEKIAAIKAFEPHRLIIPRLHNSIWMGIRSGG